MLELLTYPFVQRALIAGVVLGLLFAVLGVYVILRQMAFWGDGIAHASLAGIAIALLAGFQPMLWAIIIAVLFAVLMFYLEKKTTLSNDALIGVLFTSFMAFGVILLSFMQGYQPELISFLFGNILTVSLVDIYIMVGFSAFILLAVWSQSKQLALLTFDRESAYLAGIKTEWLNLSFYILLAISVVLGVKLLGIILVSALLIIPASIAKMLAGSYKSLKVISIVVGEVVVVSGMLLSLAWDLPTGPTIILVGAALFILVSITKIQTLKK